MKIRIYYEDTDAGGVVYHTKYIAFCERARSEFFFKQGINFNDDGFVVRDLKATFFSPAKLGDLIEVKTKINSIKKSIVLITQSIYKDDKLIFEAEIKLVYVKNWKITSIPQKYKEILNEFS
jgi:acyl-CoA thioester hydrolase